MLAHLAGFPCRLGLPRPAELSKILRDVLKQEDQTFMPINVDKVVAASE